MVIGRLKVAEPAPSPTGATATSSIPTPSIAPTPAPGKRGPVGLSPRTNYSRVNTGAPPQLDAGATSQKSMAPRGAEMLPKVASENPMGKMAGRPLLQNLVKEAIASSAARVSVNEEARLQGLKTASDDKKCTHCGKEKEACMCDAKKASAATTEKLASACEYAARLLKEGASMGGGFSLSEHIQTAPPGVSQATASTSLPDKKGQGVHVVPMHPGTQHGTQMANTQNEAPELHKHQMEKNYGPGGGKHASAGVVALIRQKLAGVKTGSDAAEQKETEGLDAAKKGLAEAEKAHKSEPENKEAAEVTPALVDYFLKNTKQAEDAINPAKIDAGKAVPPQASAAGEPGGAPAGGAPQGPRGLVASNTSAQGYKKDQAYAPRKADLGKYFKEPALSMEHDHVLRDAFNHTGQAGTKYASAPSTAQLAKRVLLSKIAEAVTDDAATQGATP